ncbi:DUF6626 family protein [Skermanella rosea]|uniref:DUF6626 family protein n=1 Tax=Skermanella rosea TaxID=1817965 RepID=UPI00389A6E20
MTLRLIYNSLHAAGLVTSQRQFSREWLQKQPSYYSSSVSRSREPSLQVLFIIYDRIRRMALSSADDIEIPCQHRKQLRRLAVEIRNLIGQRLSPPGSSGC